MAKSKDARIRVLLECTNCVRGGVNKESTGISRYIIEKSTQYALSIELQKFVPIVINIRFMGDKK
ncbi:hypothetical protein AAG906_035741 [Vitis piasezkii]